MLSIIIPCYNSGVYLMEAVESVINSNFDDVEIIVVNDGSTDQFTLSFLDQLDGMNIKVIHQLNLGPAAARNAGVLHSSGKYLFFLDSDNRVKHEYLKLACDLLDSSNDIGVVYARPYFFGSINNNTVRYNPKAFYFDRLLAGNFIDMCSFVRKETFLEVGGFDEQRDLIGWEDADLWIRIGQTKWRFHFIDEELFDYRVRKDSLMGLADQEKKNLMLRYIGTKHGFLIHQRYRQYFRVMDNIQKNPFSYFLRILYYKYILRKPFIS